jgi:8-oxo-dGTP pyrophosphatase MutT (NUDIX family)
VTGWAGPSPPYSESLMDSPDPPVGAARRSIPRPPRHRPGAAAPWAGLQPELRRRISLARVRAALEDDRAGRLGQVREPWRTLAGQVAEGRPAAVLVPLFEEGGESRVVLTVRSDHLRSHQGEVAFPGGRLERGEGVVEAALRESAEEVSLDPVLVSVIGELTAMPTISSNSVMTPVVAELERRPDLTANPAEVERVFDVALSDLVVDGVFHEEWWSVPGRVGVSGLPDGEFPVWFFDVAGETVWGATARTLMELVCLVLGVDFPPSLRAQAPAG